MYRKVLRKCFLVICISFLICPKRVAVQGKKSIQGGKKPPRQGIKNVLREQYTEDLSKQPKPDGNLDAREPGFDFIEDEIIKFKIWPEGVIPYYIEHLSFDHTFRGQLRSFLETVQGTGLRFMELPLPPEDQSRWVFFINRRGVLECQDYTTYDFTNNGCQKVVIGYDCLSQERALASTLLALAGVPPQHNAPDRDTYVQVNIENVLPDKQYLFKSLSNNEWLFHDVEYDYNSAGHFDSHKYSANGKATIIPKQKYQNKDDEIRSFTSIDLKKIKLLYNYLSKNSKVGIAKIAESNNMFLPRAGNLTYESDSEEPIKPMSKPNKYLGILENTNSLGADYQDKSEDKNIKAEVVNESSQYNADENRNYNTDKKITNTSSLKIKLSHHRLQKKRPTTHRSTQDPKLQSPYYNTDEWLEILQKESKNNKKRIKLSFSGFNRIAKKKRNKNK